MWSTLLPLASILSTLLIDGTGAIPPPTPPMARPPIIRRLHRSPNDKPLQPREQFEQVPQQLFKVPEQADLITKLAGAATSGALAALDAEELFTNDLSEVLRDIVGEEMKDADDVSSKEIALKILSAAKTLPSASVWTLEMDEASNWEPLTGNRGAGRLLLRRLPTLAVDKSFAKTVGKECIADGQILTDKCPAFDVILQVVNVVATRVVLRPDGSLVPFEIMGTDFVGSLNLMDIESRAMNIITTLQHIIIAKRSSTPGEKGNTLSAVQRRVKEVAIEEESPETGANEDDDDDEGSSSTEDDDEDTDKKEQEKTRPTAAKVRKEEMKTKKTTELAETGKETSAKLKGAKDTKRVEETGASPEDKETDSDVKKEVPNKKKGAAASSTKKSGKKSPPPPPKQLTASHYLLFHSFLGQLEFRPDLACLDAADAVACFGRRVLRDTDAFWTLEAVRSGAVKKSGSTAWVLQDAREKQGIWMRLSDDVLATAEEKTDSSEKRTKPLRNLKEQEKNSDEGVGEKEKTADGGDSGSPGKSKGKSKEKESDETATPTSMPGTALSISLTPGTQGPPNPVIFQRHVIDASTGAVLRSEGAKSRETKEEERLAKATKTLDLLIKTPSFVTLDLSDIPWSMQIETAKSPVAAAVLFLSHIQPIEE